MSNDNDLAFGSPAIMPRRKDNLRATTPTLDAYLPPEIRRRRRRARIRAMETARGLPTEVPWDDELDGSPFDALEASR